MIQLHHVPSTASMIAHILLQEAEVPFELVPIDREGGALDSAEYRRLNPNGLIPVLVDGDLVLYETAAIQLHLADTLAAPSASQSAATSVAPSAASHQAVAGNNPPSAFVAPVGSAARAHQVKWLMWLTNTLQATLITYFYPHRWVNEGNAVGAAEVKSVAERKVGGMLALLDAHLAAHAMPSAGLSGGDWFMGRDYCLLDPYVFTLCRWTRNFATRPARDYPHLGPYLQRMLARPAVQRVMAAEGLAAPFV